MAHLVLVRHGGGTQHRREPPEDAAKRAYAALIPYENEEKRIAVSHAIEETEFDRDFQ